MLPAMPRLLDAFAFSAGHPDPRLPHPAAQRLPRNFEIMTLCQLLGCECRTKVCVKLPHQSNGMIAYYIRQAVVRGTTAALVGDAHQQADGTRRSTRYLSKFLLKTHF